MILVLINKIGKTEKTDRETSITRRAVIKAGWAVPVILAIGLPNGDVFAKSSGGKGYGQYKPKKPKNGHGISGHGGGHGIS